MEELKRRAERLSQVGAEGGEPHIVHATAYYAIEAQGLAEK